MNCGDLDRLKNPVVEVTLDSPEGMDNVPISDRKPHTPARHVVTFRQRKKFDADLFSTWNLKQARCPVAVEGQIRIRQIVNDDQLVFLGKLDDPLEEIDLHHFGGRVMRKADDKQFGLWPCLFYRFFEVPQKTFAANKRNTTKIAACQNHGKLMDRIGGAGAQHNVYEYHNSTRQMR